MKKYFVVSDIHSFYNELKHSLFKAGFRKTNKDHVLIVCGDLFDRGPDAYKVYKYITSIPKCRRILIRGNHEYLYLKLLTRSFPYQHDFTNRTVDTFCQLSGVDEDYLYDYDCKEKWNEIVDKIEHSEVTKWLRSDEWKDYYELDNFIFVHSFIPLATKGFDGYMFYDEDWRHSSKERWENSTWGCPWELYKNGMFQPEEDKGKTLVCGHWHTSDFFANLKNHFEYTRDIGPIYFSKGLIGLDGGVMYSYSYGYVHPQNVMIIENGKCSWYNYDNDKIEELTEVSKNDDFGLSETL